MFQSIRRLWSLRPHEIPDARPPHHPREAAARNALLETVSKSTLRSLPTRPLSRPTSQTEPHGLFKYGAFVSHPWSEPVWLYPLFRFIRDHIPDVSAGVWAWVRLCATPQSVEYENGTEEQVAEAREVVESLDARVFEFEHMKRQGMDALVNSFFLSVFTYGAFAGEVVLKDDLSGIDKFFIIDPATIRFKRFKTSRRLVPYQVTADGNVRRLREASFFYYALDSDGDNPYGRSPLLALPFVLRIQQQMIEDMGRASHNFGHPTLHLTYKVPERASGESMTEYQDRVESNFNQVVEGIRAKEADSNFITYDNIEIEVLSPGGRGVSWKESLEAISEQVVSGLHLAPFMIGRNWGTTETWGAAQYDLLTSNAVSVQRGAKRMAEWLRNIELALAGSPVRTRHRFASHSRINEHQQAQAYEARARAAVALLEKGVLTNEEARAVMGVG